MLKCPWCEQERPDVRKRPMFDIAVCHPCYDAAAQRTFERDRERGGGYIRS